MTSPVPNPVVIEQPKALENRLVAIEKRLAAIEKADPREIVAGADRREVKPT